MSLNISDTQYIDGLDIYESSIDDLPSIDYANIGYDKKNDLQYFCNDKKVIQQIESYFINNIIATKITEPFEIDFVIQKNLPNFELIPHFDNNDMLGVILINLVNSNTSTEFYNNKNVKIGQAPVEINKGIMYLNNWDFKHGYKNNSNNNRYIAICMIYKK
jgi:hypothetical protein